jgi:hypothetical protein
MQTKYHQKIAELENELSTLAVETTHIYDTGWVRGSWKDEITSKAYYAKVSKAQAIKKEIRMHMKSIQLQAPASVELPETKEPREITCSTYKRAQKRLSLQVEGFVSGKLRR